MCIYVLCSVFGNGDRVYTVDIIHRTVHQHRYEDVTLCTINIQKLHNSPIFSPTSNHILPWRRRGRRRPPAVGQSICQSLGRFPT